MKYTIESTSNSCVETITLHDGSTYTRTHERTSFGSQCDDEFFADQMLRDGICEEILEKVDDLFDGSRPLEAMKIAELDW